MKNQLHCMNFQRNLKLHKITNEETLSNCLGSYCNQYSSDHPWLVDTGILHVDMIDLIAMNYLYRRTHKDNAVCNNSKHCY